MEERAPLSEEKDVSDNRIRSHGNARVSAKVRPPSYKKKKQKTKTKQRKRNVKTSGERASNNGDDVGTECARMCEPRYSAFCATLTGVIPRGRASSLSLS